MHPKSYSFAAHLLLYLLLRVAHAQVVYRVVHDFGAPNDGNVPSGPPYVDSTGNLYGGAGGPGQYGYGIAYELSPAANDQWGETILHTFTSTDGSPWGAFVGDEMGSLYGTTVGGPISNSVVFHLNSTAAGWNYSVLYSDGAGPGLVLDESGNLYGSMGPGTYLGAAAIAKLSPTTNGWLYTDLANFSPTVGYDPPAPPIFDSQGKLYGTTTEGGITQPKCWTAFGCGVIFKMTPNADGTAWTYEILHHFASYSTDGQSPYGGLVMDSAGNLYGTTEYGGIYNQGTIFRFALTEGRWKKKVLYNFPDWHIGALPNSTLVFDNAGNMYGVAGGGNNGCGPYTCGVVFRLAPLPNGCWKYEVIHKFSGPDGNFPIGVAVDNRGHLFGTTSAGGTYNSGVAFEITQ